jgi:5-formyltetrahydrofolate cyclo-ligase
MEQPLADLKKSARSAAMTLRATAHMEAHQSAPLALASRMFPLEATRKRNVVSGFYPYQSEIDVRPLLGVLAGQGWTTSLPVVLARGKPLEFRRWLPGEPTTTGQWDIPRPLEEAPLVEPDVLLVPLLAFDRKGYRLGYGGGFYDRTLEKFRAQRKVVAFGVAYAGQEVDAVPREPWDQPLDFIMTEKELIACG